MQDVIESRNSDGDFESFFRFLLENVRIRH